MNALRRVAVFAIPAVLYFAVRNMVTAAGEMEVQHRGDHLVF